MGKLRHGSVLGCWVAGGEDWHLGRMPWKFGVPVAPWGARNKHHLWGAVWGCGAQFGAGRGEINPHLNPSNFGGAQGRRWRGLGHLRWQGSWGSLPPWVLGLH